MNKSEKYFSIVNSFISGISPFYSLNDFHLVIDNISLKNKNLRLIPGRKLVPDYDNNIKFKSLRKLKPGWYLIGVKHTGDNFCFLKTFAGSPFFIQGRPAFSGKRRWRIIRLNKKRQLNILLENVNESLELNEIWLIKIPFLEAWRRIIFRCKEFYYFKANYFANILEIKKLWKIYNKELLSQYKDNNYETFNYQLWQSNIETKLLNEIKSLNYRKKSFNYFIQDPLKPSIVKKDGFVIILNKGDSISPWIFEILDYYLAISPDTKLISADEDFINKSGQRFNPHFKSAWNRELFWHNQNTNNCWVIDSKEWNAAIKYLKNKCEYLSLFSIITLISFNLENNKQINSIKHLPFILYHNSDDSLINRFIDYKKEFKFLFRFISNNSKCLGNCEDYNFSKISKTYKLTWSLPESSLLSIIIPTRDNIKYLDNCINSILKFEAGIKYEIIIIDNDSKELKTHKFLKSFKKNTQHNFKREIFSYSGDFNFSDMNNKVAKKVNGNVILFLNNDIEFLHSNWGYELASNALRPGIGFVGAKLLYEDNTIQHAGVILGIGGVAGHAFKYLNKNNKGYFSRILLPQEFSALTAACLAISKDNWTKLKGFDDFFLPIDYNDVDICLEARVNGLRNLYLPTVQAYHFESKSRGRPKGKRLKLWQKEKKYMLKKWGHLLYSDPSYSPYLSLLREDFSKSMKYPHEALKLRTSLIDRGQKPI